MSLTGKRYRQLWLILFFIIVGAIFIGNSSIISYEFGSTTSNSNVLEETALESRQGHPREELFTEEETSIDYTAFDTPDRTAQTHGDDIEPNFDEVFEDNTVKRLDIVISPEEWQAMLDNMTDLYGEAGNIGELGDFGERKTGSIPNDFILEEGDETRGPPPVGFDGQRGGPGGGEQRGGAGPGENTQGENTFSDEDPLFVAADIFYEEIQRYKVGIRFKGNSSLKSTWNSGNMKLSFKLDFDEFEDDYPRIENQRFYGFKQLNLKNNFDDASMLREKVASDVFINAGLVGPHTAFYTLWVDYGEGPVYFGVYTLVEEVDDSVIDTQFSNDSGNLYKPDGSAASFTEESYNEDQYVKKSNEKEADFSDVEALLNILHDETRTTDPETRRANLDEIFDTEVFLKYLAINTTIQNRDTYGRMTHNYFLYNNSETGKLTWIPRDNNEALQDGKRNGSLSLDFSDLESSQRPLIGYLYQDEIYRAIYEKYLQETIDGVFDIDTIQAQYDSYANLIEPYATTEIEGYTFLNNSTNFQTAIAELNEHVEERTLAVESYLE